MNYKIRISSLAKSHIKEAVSYYKKEASLKVAQNFVKELTEEANNDYNRLNEYNKQNQNLFITKTQNNLNGKPMGNPKNEKRI